MLGVKEEAGVPVIDALAKFVAQRRLLIILDNCEHLVRACAEIAKRLLQSGPGLKILTSSREALHMRAETTYSVPPLLMRAPDALKSAATLTQYTAPRLFVERALAVQPSFQITAENAAVIAEICHRLDGIPLAIELAAARVRALSVDAIATRLGDRFRLLTQGDITALPRQQTLRALIDWSYDLLTASERALLQRLSVFAGGWTVDAAEAVGVGDGIARHEILDLLTFLVEKSLVVLEPDRSRYRLLDTVREYAYGLLAESADEPAVRSAHLRHFVHFAEGAREALSYWNNALGWRALMRKARTYSPPIAGAIEPMMGLRSVGDWKIRSRTTGLCAAFPLWVYVSRSRRLIQEGPKTKYHAL